MENQTVKSLIFACIVIGWREVIFGIKPQNHIDASRLSGAARRDDSGQQKNQPEPLKCFHEPIDRRIGARPARTNAYKQSQPVSR